MLVGHEDMVGDEIDAQAEEDLVRGETIALPLAFVALVVVFGGLLAAVLPLALALASVAGAIILLALATATGDVAVYSINVVTMFGIGLGIDYGLIVISRFREERGRTALSVPDAIDRTVATAGRTVGYSGLTVAVALSGLLVFDSSGLRSLALGGIGVVLVAVLAGVSLLPALLALVGHRIRPVAAAHRPRRVLAHRHVGAPPRRAGRDRRRRSASSPRRSRSSTPASRTPTPDRCRGRPSPGSSRRSASASRRRPPRIRSRSW